MNTEELVMLHESVVRFIKKEAPYEAVSKWDREDAIPKELLLKMGELGICGLSIAEEYGGLGRDVPALMMVIHDLCKRSMPLASLFTMCVSYGGLNISESGSEEQKRKLLPELAAGRLVFAYGLSEPDIGGELTNVKTRVVRQGDKLIVNGTKRWCSGANIADYIYCLVRSGPVEDKRRNLSFVLIPPDALGVTITPNAVMGSRGIATNDVILDNVELPPENLVGGEAGWNNAWKMLAGPALEIEKLQPAALALATAEAALEEAWQYSTERVQFGKKICAHQAVRHSLAEARTKLEACRSLMDRAIGLVDRGEPSAHITSMNKLFVSETAVQIVLECQKVMGAYGYAESFQMERRVRDVLLMPIIGGSSAIQRNNIANLLGLPKE